MKKVFYEPTYKNLGALFFKRVMDYHGDTNGVNDNHPCTSTRIWYLQKMAKIDAFMRMTQEFKKEYD